MATTSVARPQAAGGVAPRFMNALPVALRYLLLIAISVALFAPFILSFIGTFKTDTEIIAFPPRFFPQRWLLENWSRFTSTDLGGTPRAIGATSIGLITGLFTAFLTLLFTGSSSELGGQRLARARGLPASVILAALAGVGAALFLRARLGPDDAAPVLLITIGIGFAVVMLIGVAILAMSVPDWRRVVTALAGSLVAGAVVTLILERIAYVTGGGTFPRWFFNTALLAILRASFRVIFCAMAAYSFARLRFPGKELIFSFMLATMMIPDAVKLVPQYVLISKLNWINTFYSIILPDMVVPFGIFLLTQFFKAVPHDLEEAAYIDGASYFQTFKNIVLPLARPALLTLFIIEFQGMWNDFLKPLLYFNTPDMWVLNVALSIFRQQYKAQWNLTLVGAMVNAIPILVIFFFFSKYYVQGASYSGLAGQ